MVLTVLCAIHQSNKTSGLHCFNLGGSAVAIAWLILLPVIFALLCWVRADIGSTCIVLSYMASVAARRALLSLVCQFASADVDSKYEQLQPT